MSEVPFPFRRVVPIIVVTWILSMVTTLALVYFAPNIPMRTWHEVVTFEHEFQDHDTEMTDRFHVPSNHWAIRWIADGDELAAPEDISFTLSLRGGPHHTYLAVTPADFEWRSFWSGFEYITGSGQFAVKLGGKNVHCHIVIVAYY